MKDGERWNAVLALLRRIEWTQSDERGSYCPICGGSKLSLSPRQGHYPGCELDLLIAVLEVEEP